MTSTYVRHSLKGTSPEVIPYYELNIGPGGYQLVGAFETFGPTRDPQALGTVIFALGLGVTYDADDEVIANFAEGVLGWATILTRAEQGDVSALNLVLTAGDIEQWDEKAKSTCSSADTIAEVSHQIHWMLGPVVHRFEMRRGAMFAAKDWLQECLAKAESFLGEAMEMGHLGKDPVSGTVAGYFIGYHLLRGAARLYTVPTNEELRARTFGGAESPEDVRLGYMELGLTQAQRHIGERLGVWEYALRYKPQLISFVPNPQEVEAWAETIYGAYTLHFSAVLNDEIGGSTTDHRLNLSGGHSPAGMGKDEQEHL